MNLVDNKLAGTLTSTAALTVSGLIFGVWVWLAAADIPSYGGLNGLFCFLPLTTPLLIWVIAAALLAGSDTEILGAGATSRRTVFLRLALGSGLSAIAMRCLLGLAGPSEAFVAGSMWVGPAVPPTLQPTFSCILWNAIFAAQWLALLVGIIALFRGLMAGGRADVSVVVSGAPRILEIVARIGSLVACIWWGYCLVRCVGAFWSGDGPSGNALFELLLASGVCLALAGIMLPRSGLIGPTAGLVWRSAAVIIGAAAVAVRWDCYWASGPYVPPVSSDVGVVVELTATFAIATVGAWMGATAWLVVLSQKLSCTGGTSPSAPCKGEVAARPSG